MKNRRFVLLALTGLSLMVAFMALPMLGHAQSVFTDNPKAGPLDQTFNSFRTLADSWGASGQKYARWLFVPLMSLHLLWVGIDTALAGAGDLRSGLGRWGREFLLVSFFFGMIEWGPQLGSACVQWFEAAAAEASKEAMGAAAPTIQGILDAALQVSTKVLGNDTSKSDSGSKASSATTASQNTADFKGSSDFLGSSADLVAGWARNLGSVTSSLALLALCPWLLPGLLLLFVLNVGALAAMLYIAKLWAYITIGLGTIVLGCGGSVWTRFLVPNYLKAIGSGGLVLYVVTFVQQVALASIQAWINEAVARDVIGIEVLLTMLVTTIGFTMLTLVAPVLAMVMFSGMTSTAAVGMGKALPSMLLGAGGTMGLAHYGRQLAGRLGAAGGGGAGSLGKLPATGGAASALHGAGGPTPATVGGASGMGRPLRAGSSGSAAASGGLSLGQAAGASAGGRGPSAGEADADHGGEPARGGARDPQHADEARSSAGSSATLPSSWFGAKQDATTISAARGGAGGVERSTQSGPRATSMAGGVVRDGYGGAAAVRSSQGAAAAGERAGAQSAQAAPGGGAGASSWSTTGPSTGPASGGAPESSSAASASSRPRAGSGAAAFGPYGTAAATSASQSASGRSTLTESQGPEARTARAEASRSTASAGARARATDGGSTPARESVPHARESATPAAERARGGATPAAAAAAPGTPPSPNAPRRSEVATPKGKTSVARALERRGGEPERDR